MRSLVYWMLFQMLVGIWLFVSPFAMGFKDLTGVALNNMIFGAIVVIIGLGIYLNEFYEMEDLPGMGKELHVSSSLRKF